MAVAVTGEISFSVVVSDTLEVADGGGATGGRMADGKGEELSGGNCACVVRSTRREDDVCGGRGSAERGGREEDRSVSES